MGNYFCGRTKYILNAFSKLFEDKNDRDSYKKYVLFLNKTPIYTDNMEDFKNVPCDIIEETQEKMPELIKFLLEKTDTIVWSFGINNNNLFKLFYDTLKKYKNRIIILKHPTCGQLSKDVRDLCGKTPRDLTKQEDITELKDAIEKKISMTNPHRSRETCKRFKKCYKDIGWDFYKSA